MRRLLTPAFTGRLLALWVAGLVSCKAPIAAQPVPRGAIRIGVVSYPAQPQLMANWGEEHENERAYCVTRWVRVKYPDARLADSIYRVISIEPAETDSAGSDFVNYSCPDSVPNMHTHPTDDGYPNCMPSKPDQESLDKSDEPFGVIQCGPRTFIFYYPRR